MNGPAKSTPVWAKGGAGVVRTEGRSPMVCAKGLAYAFWQMIHDLEICLRQERREGIRKE